MSVLPFLHQLHQQRYRLLHRKLWSIGGEVIETSYDVGDWVSGYPYQYACISDGTKLCSELIFRKRRKR